MEKLVNHVFRDRSRVWPSVVGLDLQLVRRQATKTESHRLGGECVLLFRVLAFLTRIQTSQLQTNVYQSLISEAYPKFSDARAHILS